MKKFAIAVIFFGLTIPALAQETFLPPNPMMPEVAGARDQKTKILIVPGHDADFSGAVFRGVTEADMTVALARKIAVELADDPDVVVTVARDETGYHPDLQKYFDTERVAIEKWIALHKEKTKKAIERGTIEVTDQITHNSAPPEAAYRLYATNKWASEEDFDFIIHVHFNDEWPRIMKFPGVHDGYAIYVPDENLPNHDESKILGEAIGKRLQRSFYKSNLPTEESKAEELGVIPDFKLIAIGANATLNTPSILIEYSYIFEPGVQGEFFPLTTNIMARATAIGIKDYISGEESEDVNLIYNWFQDLKRGKNKNLDVMALQYALHEAGFFPPENLSRNKCPITGIFATCSELAVKNFQKYFSLDADGIAGPDTRAVLDDIFSEFVVIE